jgi:hypothetical protein
VYRRQSIAALLSQKGTIRIPNPLLQHQDTFATAFGNGKYGLPNFITILAPSPEKGKSISFSARNRADAILRIAS